MVTLHLQPTVCLLLHHGVSASRCICVTVYLHSLCVFIYGVSLFTVCLRHCVSVSRCVCVMMHLHSRCVFVHGVSAFTVCPHSWCVRTHGVSVSWYVSISMCQHHRVSKCVRVPAGLAESSQLQCRSPLKLQGWFCRCEYKQTHGIAGWAWLSQEVRVLIQEAMCEPDPVSLVLP